LPVCSAPLWKCYMIARWQSRNVCH
jgi:hypothetical protein